MGTGARTWTYTPWEQELGLILHGDIQREAMREFDCCLSGEVSGGG